MDDLNKKVCDNFEDEGSWDNQRIIQHAIYIKLYIFIIELSHRLHKGRLFSHEDTVQP